MGFKTCLLVFETIGIVSAYISSYFLPNTQTFSFYGIYLLLYFIIQTITSELNDRQMRQISVGPTEPTPTLSSETEFVTIPLEKSEPKVALLVVGHRENPAYWEKCLVSVCHLDTSNLASVYIMIDGNLEQDQPMYSLAQQIIKRSKPIDFPPVHMYMVEQRGKRGMLYMGIERVRFDYPERAEEMLVAVTDSDTALRSNALVELEKCILQDPKNGCATGFLEIYNLQDGWLPKIINARYHYAFGIERASLSYFGCMTCCSGPLSIYRLSALPPSMMEKFRTQTVFGSQCEPGDDRHLTNLILYQGFHSRQTSQSIASTEAPETMIRFLLQQLRWSRSFFRELYWQVKAIDHQSYYLGFVTVYESFFPLFILIWTCFLLYLPHNKLTYLKAVLLSQGVLLIRTIIMLIKFRDLKILYNLMYYPVYFLFLLPTKVFAALTITNNTWVTQSRDTKKTSYSKDAVAYFLFILGWQVTLAAGITYVFLHHF